MLCVNQLALHGPAGPGYNVLVQIASREFLVGYRWTLNYAGNFGQTPPPGETIVVFSEYVIMQP